MAVMTMIAVMVVIGVMVIKAVNAKMTIMTLMAARCM